MLRQCSKQEGQICLLKISAFEIMAFIMERRILFLVCLAAYKFLMPKFNFLNTFTNFLHTFIVFCFCSGMGAHYLPIVRVDLGSKIKSRF